VSFKFNSGDNPLEENLREQQVTFKDYIRVLYRGRWIIAISFLAVMILTVYITFTTQPVYEASAQVLLREEGSMQQQIFEVSSFMKRETMINNQVEILRSRTLAEDVIRRLQTSPHADSLWILGSRQGDEKFSFKKWIYSLLGLNKSKGDLSPTNVFDGLVFNFQEKAIGVVPKRDTDMIELKIQAFSPFEAAFVANTWMEAYRALDIKESSAEVSEVVKFLEEKLEEVDINLSESEQNLRRYKETEKVAELTTETQQMIQQLAEFETQYQAAKTDLEANTHKLTYMKSQLDENQRAMLEKAAGLSSPMIQELEKQLAQNIGEKVAYEQQLKGAGLYSSKDTKLASMEQRVTGLHEKIIEETRKMVASGGASLNPMALSESLLSSILIIETENKSLNAKSEALAKIVGQFNRELNKLPAKSLRLAQLKREEEVNNKIYIMMREKYEENRIAEAGQIGSVRIVDTAKSPRDPIKPKKKMNLILGVLLGLGLGVGITFIREYLDTSLKSIEEVERIGFPVLGSIPLIVPSKISGHTDSRKGGEEISRIESRLITHLAPKSPISEAYRTLRTNIQYSRADRSIKTVLVTSSGPGEGKSTSVTNLAITFAQMGTKTLLVDTDLRRPVQHGIFKVPLSGGLTNVLIGKLSMEEAIQSTKVENLSLLTAGTLPPNPSELLNSSAMESFLKAIEKQYDIALFDSPPIIAVTDAAVLATRMDGVILVAKSGGTGKDALLRSRVLLENVNAKIFGVLLNGMNISHMYGSYYYYHHYYYADGKNPKKRRKARA
jgi:capsular exopolysaccharide synthesis family protein